MKSKTQDIHVLTLLLLTLASISVFGQTTAFNYTGYLLDGTNAVTGGNDLQFTLYTAPSGGLPVAGSLTLTNQPVNNGVFVVALDFGDVFDGSARWLEIGTRPGGSANSFTNTFPRQSITATPYATFANNGKPVGGVIAFVGVNPPAGWLLCDGSAISRTTYARLFANIGTMWGSGDGTTTFNLPDLRGMFLRGVNGSRADAYADPDILTRTNIASGGNTGNAVGSIQLNTAEIHTHTYSKLNLSQNARGFIPVIGAAGNPNFITLDSGEAGGNETRPKNAYVNYIIKY
jgi:microcystin-dependent protein